jgi:acyl dehydratase
MRALQARPELQMRLGAAPQIAQVKFLSPVLPGTDLQVQLQAQGSGVAFEVRREGQVVTKGQLTPGAAA